MQRELHRKLDEERKQLTDEFRSKEQEMLEQNRREMEAHSQRLAEEEQYIRRQCQE